QIERALRELEGGTGREAAHGAAAEPALVAHFERLLLQHGHALGLGGVGEGVSAAVVVGLDAWRVLAADGRHGGRACGDAALGLVVPAEHGGAGRFDAPRTAEGLDGVLLFLTAGTVEADAPVADGAGAGDVFRA